MLILAIDCFRYYLPDMRPFEQKIAETGSFLLVALILLAIVVKAFQRRRQVED